MVRRNLVPYIVFATFMEPLGTRSTKLALPMQEDTFLDQFFDEGTAMAGNVMPLEENTDDMGIVTARHSPDGGGCPVCLSTTVD